MEVLAELCIKHDVIVFANEVYEWMVYDNSKHIKIGDVASTYSHIQYKYSRESHKWCVYTKTIFDEFVPCTAFSTSV